MKRTMRWVGVGLVFSLSLGVAGVQAQQPVAAEPQAPSGTVQAPREVVPPLPVPRLVKFAGVLKDELGKPRTGVVGVTFAIYKEQESGAALWLETQNAELDEQGHYTVLLGATKSEGLPLELFSAGEPRWLGVQVNLAKEVEQPRVLLVSVPYALKAADADTLGGKPVSAFLTTEQAGGGGTTGKPNGSAGIISPAVSGAGSTNVVAKWLDSVGTLGNSQITDDGTNVNMAGNVGALAYKFTGNAGAPTDATATIFNQAFVGPVFSGLSFKVRTGAPVPADALSIDQSQNASIAGNASALAYKFTGNAAAPTDATATIFNQAFVGPTFSGLSFSVRTGATPANALTVDQNHNLRLSNGGALVFPDGSVMSSAATGVGGGTITGVTAGTGLSGGGTAGNATLGIANGGVTNALLAANSVTNANIADGSLTPAKITGIAATLGPNSFTGNQLINGNVGIGTPTPAAKLDVNGAFHVETGNSWFRVEGPALGTANPVLASWGGTGDFSIDAPNITGGRFVVKNSGAVGIGTAIPRPLTGLNVVGSVANPIPIFGETSQGGGASGVQGLSFSTGSIGVYGNNQGGGGVPGFLTFNIGVAGQSNNGIGVEGSAETGTAVSGRVGTSGGTLFTGVGISGTPLFRVDSTGKGFFDGGTQTGGADFAEAVAVRGERGGYEPGDVLTIDPSGHRRLTLSQSPYSPHVAGIYSTKPGVLATIHPLNESDALAGEIPLAIVGIVPCKVTAKNGPIASGDLLVTSSTPGYAMKGTDRRRMLGAVVGKALEPLREGKGVIQVLVTLQ